MNFNATDDIISLLEFIETKKHTSESSDLNEILCSYLISIKMALINTYTEQGDAVMALSCSDLIANIFILIYSYSLNIKLSLFICERAILLFNEYMNISNNYNSNPVNISDIKQFIINKSIGPIILQDTLSSITDLSELFNIMKLFTNKIFIKCKNESTDYIESVLENILKVLPSPMIHLFLKGHLFYINGELEDIDLIESEEMFFIINKLKIKFEIFLFIYNSDTEIDIEKIKKLTNKTIKNNKILNKLDEVEEHNQFDIFKEIIKSLF